VINPTVTLSSTAGGALAEYDVTFETASNLGPTGSITMGMPTGTGTGSVVGTVYDTGLYAHSIGTCLGSTSAPLVSCSLFNGVVIPMNNTIEVQLYDVVNPPGPAIGSLRVETSSDYTWAFSPDYAISTATSVSGVSVTLSTTAAHALAEYDVTLTTSFPPTGALTGSNASSVTVTLPAGTGTGTLAGSVRDAGAGNAVVGSCSSTTAGVAGCRVTSTVAPHDTLKIELTSVVNPSSGSRTLSVSTSSDTAAVTSPSYTITPASSVSKVGVASTSLAAGALSTFDVGFSTSATGALSGDNPGTVIVTLPVGTSIGTGAGVLYDVTAGDTAVGSCGSSGSVATCTLTSGTTVAGGDALEVELPAVTNPSSPGAETLSVSTSSDTVVKTSPSYTVVPAAPVSAVTTTVSDAETKVGGVTYTVGFTTSATGALSGASPSGITITLPAGTAASPKTKASVSDTGTQIAACTVSATVATCPLASGAGVAAGDPLVATLTSMTNPATTAPYTVSVTTSSDTVAAQSAPYCIAAIGVPCVSSVSPARAPVGATVTVGGVNLSGASAIGFNGTGATIGADSATQIATTVPAGATTGPVTVTTPGGTATSPTPFVLASAVSNLGVGIAAPSASAGARTDYAVAFTTSPTGGLGAGSTITVTLPAGTSLASLSPSRVSDAGLAVGSCTATSSTVATCTIASGSTVHGGDNLFIDLEGATNPAAGIYHASVATSSDTATVTSPAYVVEAVSKVGGLSVAASSSSTLATGVTYAVGLRVTHALWGAAGGTVTVTLPAGTGLTGLTGATMSVGATVVGTCAKQSASVARCTVTSSSTVAAGSGLVVTLPGLTNPASTSPYSLAVRTSSDTGSVSTRYCIAATGAPCISGIAPASGPVGTTVTVKGVNLSGATTVSFNATPGVVTGDTATKIVAKVPSGATSGPVTVTTGSGTATSPKSFTVS
jgi:hypothetical protein